MTEEQENLQNSPVKETKVEAAQTEEVIEPAKEENVVENSQNDETKNQVLEKYMKKKSFKRNLSYFFVLGVSLVLATMFLVLGVVKTNIMPNFLIETPANQFEIYKGNVSQKTIIDENDNYADFNNSFKDAFSMSLLSAMFTGQTGGYYINETGEDVINLKYTTYESLKSAIPTLLGKNDYVRVAFDQTQKLKNSDGSVYKSVKATQYDENNQIKPVTYSEFYFALQDKNGYQNIEIVVPVYGNYKKNNKFDDSVANIVKITVNANLYDFTQKVENIVA